MSRKYGMFDIDKKYNEFSCDYSEQTGRLLAEIFDGYIKDGYKICVDMDGETVYVNIMDISGIILNPLLPTTKMVKMDLNGVYMIFKLLAQNHSFS